MTPEDKYTTTQKSGVIHRCKCDRVECDEEYIDESASSLEARLKEHLKPPSMIYEYSNITDHHTSVYNFSTVGRESQNLTRTTEEATFIKVNAPSLKRNIGKYQLPHMWMEALFNTPELKLK